MGGELKEVIEALKADFPSYARRRSTRGFRLLYESLNLPLQSNSNSVLNSIFLYSHRQVTDII